MRRRQCSHPCGFSVGWERYSDGELEREWFSTRLDASHGDTSNQQSARNGTLNVLRQATAQGISKIVVTSSWGAALNREAYSCYHGLSTTYT